MTRLGTISSVVQIVTTDKRLVEFADYPGAPILGEEAELLGKIYFLHVSPLEMNRAADA
jgi:hypothetical protein